MILVLFVFTCYICVYVCKIKVFYLSSYPTHYLTLQQSCSVTFVAIVRRVAFIFLLHLHFAPKFSAFPDAAFAFCAAAAFALAAAALALAAACCFPLLLAPGPKDVTRGPFLPPAPAPAPALAALAFAAAAAAFAFCAAAALALA